MTRNLDWDALYKAARENIKPTYRKLRSMDSDDWLASVGLERRNVATDVFSAFGFILLGCAFGVGIGMLIAPKPGHELRRDLNRKVRETREQIGKEQPTYAS